MEITTRKENIQLQNTTIPSLQKITRSWYFLDLKGKTGGRIGPKVAEILRGKGKLNFLPNLDLGDHVVLVNAKHIKFTGNNKMDNEFYYDHSGYPGGLRKRSTSLMLEKYPRELIFRIIKGMMPHNKLSNKQLKRLFIYPTSSHNHKAQEKNFIKIDINE
ncbi:MAG: 50S ribosomal protein L13 [Mycoplasmataceae bacterium]|nr:MAG: 50S ribosomal protein L13 [Mycoplasmataceae bacterium]